MRGDGEALVEGFPGEGQRRALGGRVRNQAVVSCVEALAWGSGLAFRKERPEKFNARKSRPQSTKFYAGYFSPLEITEICRLGRELGMKRARHQTMGRRRDVG